MRRFLLGKLVRDNIAQLMEADGQKPVLKTLTDIEYQLALCDKAVEEAEELRASKPGEELQELADLQEVIDAKLTSLGLTNEQLRAAQIERRASRGGFNQRLYIEQLELNDDDPWVEYFASQPHRFPEVKT